MVRPDKEAIETFMSITGVSEAAAIQKLEEHHGSLNEAVNAYFTEEDRNIPQEAYFGVPEDDIMDIDDPIQVESRRPQSFLLPFSRDVNHFSPLESDYSTSIIDNVTDIVPRASRVSRPREVMDIPTDVKDGTGTSAQSGSGPIVEDITETAHVHGSETRGPVIIDDGDDDEESTRNVRITEIFGHGNRGSLVQYGASAPTVIDVPDDTDDIEEEMIRAAIEASKQDAAMSNQQHNHLDLGDPTQPVQSQGEDAELAHAVSLSLQTTEREIVPEELEKVGTSQLVAQKSSSPDDMGRLRSADGRLPQLEIGSTSVQDENEDVEERQLVRHRRRRMTSSSSDATKDVEGAEVNAPSSPQPNNNNVHHPEQNRSVFPTDEWGGISSEEHDEAAMLEAAMFGGIPEGTGYHFPRAPHRMMSNGLHRDVGPNPWSIPCPPSPSLTARRLIREQQDDEYFSSLQADREKELKAKEEAEAALAEERRKEDEFRRQQQEEEETERQLAAKEASLPQEPTSDDENAITLLVRMPDGSRRGRRFQKSDKLQYLFDFIDVGRGVTPGSYKLMLYQRFIIRHGGGWNKSDYIGGDEQLICLPHDRVSYSQILSEIHEIVWCDQSTIEYCLFYLSTVVGGGRSVKSALKSNDDILRMIAESLGDPVIYVITRLKQTSQSRNQVRVEVPQSQRLVRSSGPSISLPDNFEEEDEATSADDDGDDDQEDEYEDEDEDEDERRLFDSLISDFADWIRIPGQLDRYGFHDCDFSRSVHTEGSGSADEREAELGQAGGVWRVFKVNLVHTCEVDLERVALHRLPAKVLGRYFSRKLRIDGAVLRPKDMMAELLNEFGIQIEYNFALRARNIAIEMVFGQFDKSYEMLPSYLHMLQSRNPGTLYNICTSQDGLFKHMFLALGPCADVFASCLRPVIVVDGTHLKGRNKGIIFVAVTKDGNEQIFPLAVGIGLIEDDESWIWFMQRLHRVYGNREGLVIVSDQHKSIKNAVASVFPHATHALCFYHMVKNMSLYGAQVAVVLRDAAYCYRHEKFQKNMSVLENLSPEGAHRKLLEIGVHHWARSRCSTPRYSFVTSNVAKSMNARLVWARRLPICALLESYRAMVETWFHERRTAARARDHGLTEVTMKKLSKSMEYGRQFTVRATTTHFYKVEGEHRSYLIDLEHRTCDCCEFQLDEIPCCHASVAIRFASQPIFEYVAHYYKQFTLAQTYDRAIMDVPHPLEWILEPSVSAYVVRPPVIV